MRRNTYREKNKMPEEKRIGKTEEISADSHDKQDHHDHVHHHAHHHDPEEKKRQINRLSRAIGHLQHVRVMIESDVDCAEVLMQIAAVRSALNGLGKQIINEHISHCIVHAVEDGDMAAIEEFQEAIRKFM